jgi:hypothetical protein
MPIKFNDTSSALRMDARNMLTDYSMMGPTFAAQEIGLAFGDIMTDIKSDSSISENVVIEIAVNAIASFALGIQKSAKFKNSTCTELVERAERKMSDDRTKRK